MGTRDTFDQTVRQPMDRPSRPEKRSARLSVVYPTKLAAVIEVGAGTLVVGRRPAREPNFRVEDGTVSREHFALTYDAALGIHTGADLGSRNGSRVDGRDATELDGPRALADGAVIRVGDVLIVYEVGPLLDAADAPEVSRDAVPGSALGTIKLRAQLLSTARDPSPVLLVGETGTGKEYLAREIHRLSGRTGPFVAVNCAALSPLLIESQLFGHKKGAFTGAQSSEEGLFRSALGGTIFLDEIGELPIELQPKLLRVIQEREVHPVGETRPVKIDVRIVSATLRDLTDMIGTGPQGHPHLGGFRRDLYARLSPWEIRVPALRERRADVIDWLERLHGAWHSTRSTGGSVPPLGLGPSAAERILLGDWPDNLRGLERMVHRAAGDPTAVLDVTEPGVAGSTTKGARDVASGAASDVAGSRERPSKEELESVLERHGGSVRATAKHFGRDRRQIYRWMELYGLRADEP